MCVCVIITECVCVTTTQNQTDNTTTTTTTHTRENGTRNDVSPSPLAVFIRSFGTAHIGAAEQYFGYESYAAKRSPLPLRDRTC